MTDKNPEWKMKLRAKAALFHRAFVISPDGSEALKALQLAFKRSKLLADTPEKTAYNIGQFELISYIEELMEAEL